MVRLFGALGRRKKSLRLAAKIDDTVPAELLGDAVRINQVLIQCLVSNAVKFTDRGRSAGPAVSASGWRRPCRPNGGAPL